MGKVAKMQLPVIRVFPPGTADFAGQYAYQISQNIAIQKDGGFADELADAPAEPELADAPG